MIADATKLKLPILAAVGMLSAVGTWAGTWAVASERLTTQGARIERVETRLEAKERADEVQRLELQLTKQAMANLVDMVKEIRSDVKELKRR